RSRPHAMIAAQLPRCALRSPRPDSPQANISNPATPRNHDFVKERIVEGSGEPWEGQPARGGASWPRHFPYPRMTAPTYTTNDSHLAAFLVSEGADLLAL